MSSSVKLIDYSCFLIDDTHPHGDNACLHIGVDVTYIKNLREPIRVVATIAYKTTTEKKLQQHNKKYYSTTVNMIRDDSSPYITFDGAYSDLDDALIELKMFLFEELVSHYVESPGFVNDFRHIIKKAQQTYVEIVESVQ